MPAIEILSDRLPSVAIVGRPNIGKSTLFNRVTGRRKAVVLDEPGMTRDRNHEIAEWNGRRFSLVDTGGYETDPHDSIFKQMREQSMIAMREADVIVFLANVRDQIHPDDEDVANLLRRTHKPVILAVNKCDNPRFCQEALSFYALGFEHLVPISALNGDGTGDLLDLVVENLPPETGDTGSDKGIRIAIIGKPNAGKSSLFNALLGENRVIVSDIAGTTRDSIDTTFRLLTPEGAENGTGDESAENLSAEDSEDDGGMEVFYPDYAGGETTEAVDEESGWHDEDEDDPEEDGATAADDADDDDYGEYVFLSEEDDDEESEGGARETDAGARRKHPGQVSKKNTGRVYTIVDTAGLRRRGKIQRGIEKLSVFSAQASLRRCDIALVIIDAAQGLTEQDAHVAGFAHEEKRGCIVLLNKWDLVEKDNFTHDLFVKNAREQLGFLNYAPIVTISAKTLQRVHRVLPLVEKVYDEFNKWIDTPTLNRWLDETVKRLSPPWRKGHQLRMKYVTQVAVRPPTFVFFVNNPRLVHFSYERYLQNRLREAFGFEGCPIRLRFKAKSKNIFEENEEDD